MCLQCLGTCPAASDALPEQKLSQNSVSPVISPGSTVRDDVLCKCGEGSRGGLRAVLRPPGLSPLLALPRSCPRCRSNTFSEPLARATLRCFLVYASSFCNSRSVPSSSSVLFSNTLEIGRGTSRAEHWDLLSLQQSEQRFFLLLEQLRICRGLSDPICGLRMQRRGKDHARLCLWGLVSVKTRCLSQRFVDPESFVPPEQLIAAGTCGSCL